MIDRIIADWHIWISDWRIWAVVVGAVVLLVVIWRRRHWGSQDIAPKTLESELQWEDDAAASASIGKIYGYVLSFCEGAVNWYQTKRRPKKQWGLVLRSGALVLTALAAIVPIADDLGIEWSIDPAWSTALLVAAGVFVSIDLLLGHTSGWVRYMLAQQKIERLRDEFMIDWNMLKSEKTDAKGMLERAQAFVLAVGKVVDDETREWATEFQNALREMEKARIKAEEKERMGAVEVTVKKPDSLSEWVLEIDGGERGRTSGRTIAVTDVRGGIRMLRASGEDANGEKYFCESVANVVPGTTIKRELELS